MLKVYLNELRKVKRQKTVRMIMLVGVLMPTFSFALCLWGATLSLLLGVSGVFVANGRAVNWHPITYCFSFIQCDSIYTTVLKIPFSCLAIVLYLLLSVIIYVFMYRKQEYPVS